MQLERNSCYDIPIVRSQPCLPRRKFGATGQLLLISAVKAPYAMCYKGCPAHKSWKFTEATCRNLQLCCTLPALGSAAAKD